MFKATETIFTLGLVTLLMGAVLMAKVDPDTMDEFECDKSEA